MTRAPAGSVLACLCIAGPTASGKSRAAMALAEHLAPRRGVEIVSVDSAQVYRGMDIGTAKASLAERAAVPHHLIDILDPAEHYSAAKFVADATRLIAEIAARGALPLLVGGTMLYFKALFEGLDAMPEGDATVRAAIDARAASEGWPALHAELASLDPPTAARLSPNDAQRIQRALEVHTISGRPLSAWHTDKPRVESPPLISLEPSDRAWLHARIGERFAAMLDAGLVDEVRALRARGDLHPDLPSMRAVGYRQTWAALEAGDLAALPAAGSAATRQLAKRQLTWLRAMPARRVVACDAPDAIARVVALADGLVAAEDPAMPVLEIASLAKRYGEAVVFEHVDLVVRAGEFVAVLGESGVGKSTLLNCIAGLDRVDAGSVRIGRVDVPALAEPAQAAFRRDHLGFVFQAFHVLPHLTVAANVGLPLLLQDRGDDVRVAAILAAVGLAGFETRLPQTLSGGQLQRVAIARALVHRPHLILADEPTGNLDPATADRIMTLLAAQVREQRAACLLATHSRAAAARADRVVTLTPQGIVAEPP